MTTFNTDNFPDISFIEDTTIDEVLTQMIDDFLAKYEELTGEKISLAQANPYRLIMYASAVQIYQAMQYADYAGKQSFLTYATGDFLDNLAAMRGVTRIEATAAVTILQFSISDPIASAVSIPAGTRVTNGNDVYFATDEYAEIRPGQTSVTVSATCTDAGLTGNGFAVGELNTVVNTLPYIGTVSNTVATSGGADRESDENLKERIYSIPGSYSTAGPAGAYIFHTKNVSSEIGDVAVSSPEPCEVVVKFIMADGSLPSAAMIQKVQDYLDDNDIRPLTDVVTVGAPNTATYNINLTYYIGASDTSAVSTIQADVEAAVSAYNIWQTEKIGRDINPSYLIKKIMEAGAKRVVVNSPVFTAVNESTVAKTGTVTVNYGGVESD
mgnify:CR=1 FL=1